MLDNVVEINGLPLGKQRDEIERKRRHGMGFLGLGSTLTMLGMKYGSPESIEFTERVARDMALAGWEQALELAREKGPAPLMEEEFEVTGDMLRRRPEMEADGYRVGDRVSGRVLWARYSRYMQRVAEQGGMVQAIERVTDPMAIGVQWHPEHLFYRRAQRRIFAALVAAARARTERRAEPATESSVVDSAAALIEAGTSS